MAELANVGLIPRERPCAASHSRVLVTARRDVGDLPHLYSAEQNRGG
jgi:hypothetical protein